MASRLNNLVQAIQAYEGPPLRLMEICGTHTHQLSHFGIPALLPRNIALISGPGCPVCVTPGGYIDRAVELALEPGCTVLSFGDMLRVPGSNGSLQAARAAGGSVSLMYSPLDAVEHARRQPECLFVVAAVGFETTLPLYALLIKRLAAENIRNVRLLVAGKALLPALRWLCENSPEIDGFIGPGHVSTILGWGSYEPLCRQYRRPMAVAGFGYEHLIAALYDLMQQAVRGRGEVHNLYPGAVTRAGNLEAQALIDQYFVRVPSVWRGLGEIPDSGYALAPAFKAFDAGGYAEALAEPDDCLCGNVITGRAQPVDCGCFGTACTPGRPLGPCMVSSEGACGIWYATARHK